MKKFKTISEYEILELAWFKLNERWLSEEKRLERNPQDETLISRAKKARARLDEVQEALMAIERAEPDKLKRVATAN